MLGHRVDQFESKRALYNSLARLIGLLHGDLRLARGLDVSLCSRLRFIGACVRLRRKHLKDSFSVSIGVRRSLSIRRIIVPSVMMRVPIRGTLGRKLTKVSNLGLLNVSIYQGKDKVLVSVYSGKHKCSPRALSSAHKAKAKLGILCRAVRLLGSGGHRGVHFRVGGLIGGKRAKARILVCVPLSCSCGLWE